MSEETPSESIDFLDPIKGPELVFGLVGPIGVDMKLVSKILAEELNIVRYKSIEIHATDLLDEIDVDFELISDPLEKRYDSYIQAGNTLRENIERPDVFSLLSVAAIRSKRKENTGDPDAPSDRTSYIINQFKRPEEIQTLRRVYGRGFVQISAYSSKTARLNNLTKRISESHYRERDDQFYRGKAYDLIARDNAEEEIKMGQRVRDTFPTADVIIDASSKDNIRSAISSFIRAFFSDNFMTPTMDEYGMFAAKAASLRSSDLSRQVGAVIMSSDGEFLSVGSNEVPKAHGGTYWSNNAYDYRDFRIGYDSGAKMRKDLVIDIFRRIKNKNWLSDEKNKKELEELYEEAIENPDTEFLKDSHVMDVLEYGRMIHAEMSAITDAARTGRNIKDSILYTTTFPCHMCARHIVAAGVRKVVYLEPYSKSLAIDLYPDSISVEGEIRELGPKVEFVPFVGIAPERYSEIFTKGRRKDKNGNAVLWDSTVAEPILNRLVPAYLEIEKGVLKSLGDRMKKNQIQFKAFQ